MSNYFIIILFLIANLNYTTGGYVRICNRGAYLAKCYLETRSFDYAYPTVRYDTDLFPVLQCSRLDIPFDVIWGRLECKALVFIGIYRTIFTEEFSSGLLNSCYTIRGNILNPTWSQTRCS